MATGRQVSRGSAWADIRQQSTLKSSFLALIWVCFGLTLLPSLVPDVEAATEILFGPETFLRGKLRIRCVIYFEHNRVSFGDCQS